MTKTVFVWGGSASAVALLAGSALAAGAIGAGGIGGPMGSRAPVQPSIQNQYPMARPMTPGNATQIPLTQMPDVNTLNSASVQDRDGNAVGSVYKVILGSDGRPSQVQVVAEGTPGMAAKVVTIDASRMKYERNRNVIVANLTRSEIAALPAVQGT